MAHLRRFVSRARSLFRSARAEEELALVLGQSLVLTAVGIALGIGGAAIATRYLDNMLFGVSPLDPTTYLFASVAFAAIASLAAYVPAHRAAKVDPLIALRHE